MKRSKRQGPWDMGQRIFFGLQDRLSAWRMCIAALHGECFLGDCLGQEVHVGHMATQVRVQDSFAFLGIEVNPATHWRARRQAAWRAFWSDSSTLCNRRLSLSTRWRRLFQKVWPVLTWGVACLTWSTSLWHEFNACWRGMVKTMLGVRRVEGTPWRAWSIASAHRADDVMRHVGKWREEAAARACRLAVRRWARWRAGGPESWSRKFAWWRGSQALLTSRERRCRQGRPRRRWDACLAEGFGAQFWQCSWDPDQVISRLREAARRSPGGPDSEFGTDWLALEDGSL